jgi:hypothetical protein
MMQVRIGRRALILGALASAAAGPRALDLVVAAHDRRRTIAALVDAVGAAGGSPLDPSDVRGATRRIVADTRTALPSRRRAVDQLLTALERERFADRGRQARLDFLRTWSHADLAVALVASGFGPAGDDYRPVPVAI